MLPNNVYDDARSCASIHVPMNLFASLDNIQRQSSSEPSSQPTTNSHSSDMYIIPPGLFQLDEEEEDQQETPTLKLVEKALAILGEPRSMEEHQLVSTTTSVSRTHKAESRTRGLRGDKQWSNQQYRNHHVQKKKDFVSVRYSRRSCRKPIFDRQDDGRPV